MFSLPLRGFGSLRPARAKNRACSSSRIGSLCNRFLIYLIRISNYVQVPLKNLADWNENVQKAP